jgi:CHASE3 domain sensor protein
MRALYKMTIAGRLLVGFGSLMLMISAIGVVSIAGNLRSRHSMSDVTRLGGDDTLTQRIEKRVTSMPGWLAPRRSQPREQVQG